MTAVNHAAIYEKLGRMDAKLDLVLAGSLDREVRIRKLEQHRNWFAGVLAAVGLGGATATVPEMWEALKNVIIG